MSDDDVVESVDEDPMEKEELSGSISKKKEKKEKKAVVPEGDPRGNLVFKEITKGGEAMFGYTHCDKTLCLSEASLKTRFANLVANGADATQEDLALVALSS